MGRNCPIQGGEKCTRMVRLEGSHFKMGSNVHYADEAPMRERKVDTFWIDEAPVTNAQFARFVESTGYITFCELPPDAEDYPGILPEMMRAGSLVFVKPPRGSEIQEGAWWTMCFGASWRAPFGPGSSIVGLEDHPVVHVTFRDADAYAKWAGKRLPTEAEWEFAARGGLDGAEYAWGNELEPSGKVLANYWSGPFPFENAQANGWQRTSPVGSYAPNGFGLYDMIGNVWEWTADWYTLSHRARGTESCCGPVRQVTSETESYDPAPTASKLGRKVLKGGSHLCAPNYCRRYRPAARWPQPVDTSTSHVGFRCVRSA